jgi:hypothetical protein
MMRPASIITMRGVKASASAVVCNANGRQVQLLLQRFQFFQQSDFELHIEMSHRLIE